MARDRVLDLPVAIKVIRPHIARSMDFRYRFLTEISLQARFQHPHLVPIHDAGQLPEGFPFVAMAYADRGSLDDLLPEGLPWPEAFRLIDETLAALAALHARGVVHRDLKPGNLLLHTGLDQKPHVWIADLGIASLLEGPELPDAHRVGTPRYMAPEQLAGRESEIGRETDLFTVGRLLALLLARHPVPEGTEEIVMALQHPLPEGRPALAADLRLALAALGPPLRPLDPRAAWSEMAGNTTWVASTGELAPEPDSPHVLPSSRRSADTASEGAWPRWRSVAPPVPPLLPPRPGPCVHPARASHAIYAHREPEIVGRDREIETLWRLAREVHTTGSPRVAVVVGEPGAGRTRLVESFAQMLEEGGWAEHIAVRYEDEPVPTNGLGGALRRLLRIRAGPQPVSRGDLARAVEKRFPGLDPNVVPTDRASFAGQLVQWALQRICWRGLACLIVDDAGLARQDGEGLDLPLRLLSEAAVGQATPVLVLCTLDAESLAEDFGTRQGLAALEARGATRLDLPRLTLEETRVLLDRSLDLAPEIRDAVASRCEGNPLLARQILECLADQGLLEEVGDLAYTLRSGVSAVDVLPEDARAYFLERADRAARATTDPEAARGALAALALAGNNLPEALVNVLAPGLGPTFEAFGILSRTEGRYVFTHQILHEALREAARSRQDRQRQYRLLADAWLGVAALAGENWRTRRAEALLEAGEPRLAFEPLARAAIQEQSDGRSRWALVHGEAAIRAHEEAGLGEALPLLSRLYSATARACLEVPRLERAENLAWRAYWSARDIRDRGLAALALGEVSLRRGSWAVTRGMLLSVVAEIQDGPQTALLSDMKALLGRGGLRAGDRAAAIQALEAAVEVERSLRRPGRLAEWLRMLAEARLLVGSPGEALAHASESLSLCPPDTLAAALARWTLARVEGATGDPVRALALLEQAALDLARDRTAVGSIQGSWILADLQRARGDHTETRRRLHPILQWSESRSLPFEALDALKILLQLDIEDENDTDALQTASRMTGHLAHVASPSHRLFMHVASVIAELRLGREGAARSAVAAARGMEGGLVGDPDLGRLLHLCGQLLSVRGWRPMATWAKRGERGIAAMLGRKPGAWD
jgi:tetratricopeptide (TPR) repeat protein